MSIFSNPKKVLKNFTSHPFTSLRDGAETGAVLAGNYLLPGSSLLTSHLVSNGSQEQLNSPLGIVGQLGTGLVGAGVGSSLTGIPSAAAAGAGWSGVGNALGLTGEGGILGTAAGTPVAGGVGPTQGTGFLGGATRGLSSLGAALSTGTGGGGSSYGGLGTVAALGGAANSLYANDKAEKALLDAQNRSISEFQPYLDSGAASNKRLSELLGTGGDSNSSGYGALTKPFTPGDLTQDPGYQFQLEQGTNAINRTLGAKGQLFSGAALKAAQEYGTGLADQTYKDAYSRDLQNKQNLYNEFAGQSGAGQSAAGNASDIYNNASNARAGADISSANITNQTLASILSGSGAKRPVYANGQIYYV